MSLVHGDCLEVMAGMEPESFDAIVTDPPYGLSFMAKDWDAPGSIGGFPTRRTKAANTVNTGVSRQGGRQQQGLDFQRRQARDARSYQEGSEAWARAAYRVAKPSAYLLSFGGTRTVHRLVVGIEDAGWIIRDMLVWAYASGFPKSKASLKPAWEPIVMARKPGPLRMLAIDECRIATSDELGVQPASRAPNRVLGKLDYNADDEWRQDPAGRWPANVILTDEVFESGVPGVVIAGSLTGTMTAWLSSPDSGPSPTVSPASHADRKSSRSGLGVSFHASATAPVGTQLDAWGTSTDTRKPDTGCSGGMKADGSTTSGSTGTSGSRRTARSREATSSTTETATGSTTDSTISNSSPEPSTTGTTRPNRPESSRLDGTREPGTSDGLSDDSVNWRRSSPLAASRAGEPSADRRYTERGSSDFAPLPGERREVDGLGYSRFFLIPKADRTDREPVLGGLAVDGPRVLNSGSSGRTFRDGEWVETHSEPRKRANSHPTVKPVDLMRHLVRLVTPAGGTVLDPFAGSGSTLLAAEMEGFGWTGIEKEAEYVAIAEARLNGTQRGMGLVG